MSSRATESVQATTSHPGPRPAVQAWEGKKGGGGGEEAQDNRTDHFRTESVPYLLLALSCHLGAAPLSAPEVAAEAEGILDLEYPGLTTDYSLKR